MTISGSPSAWESAKILDVPPPDDLPEAEPLRTASASYWECGFTGWHLTLAWLAGPATIVRFLDTRERYADVTEYARDGRRRRCRRLESAEDLTADEEAGNGYLREVGLPDRRPHGYRWFQVLPEGRRPADVHAATHRAIAESGLPDTFQLRDAIPFIRTAIERLYRT